MAVGGGRRETKIPRLFFHVTHTVVPITRITRLERDDDGRRVRAAVVKPPWSSAAAARPS